MNTGIVFKVDVAPERVRQTVALGRWMHENYDGQAAQDVAIRAALCKDPQFMAHMEAFISTLDRMVETEQGESRRSSTHWYRPEPAVQQVYRKAFEAAQDGKYPHLLRNFACQLGAMAVDAGITPRPYNAPSLSR